MSKKVISFSLYGKHPDYTVGAIANARHVNRAYPGWVCRFYVADDVPEGVISRLKDYDAEIVSMGRRVGHESMFWRFFAAVDPKNDITLVRDTDSRFTKCELLMVNEWLASGKKFHVIRWDLLNREIMGGLWGVRGAIPNLRNPLENCLRLAMNTRKGTDQTFLANNLYPQMKGNVFVHEFNSRVERRYFVGETIHSPPPIAEYKRGRYLNIDFIPVGMRMPSRRSFVVLSIYKRTIFSEFFLTLWLGMGNAKLFRHVNPRFYVADNIRPDLIERLGRLGQVILKSAETVHKEDPQYWKLSILSEKNLNLVVIVDFWQIFFLARIARGREKIRLYELLPIEHGLPSRIRTWFKKVATLSVYGPTPPVSDIDNLVARRDPGKNYREFIRSTVYPRTSTTRMTIVLGTRGKIGFLKGFAGFLLPERLYEVVKNLKKRKFPNRY